MGTLGAIIDLINRFESPWKEIFWAILIIGLTGFLTFKTFHYIPHGYEAMLLRNKKVVFRNGKPVYRGPGLRIATPLVNNFELVGTLDRVYDLRSVPIWYPGYATINITATVIFVMEDIYRHRYTVEDPVNRLTSECEAILQQCVQEISKDALARSASEIEAAFMARIESVAWEVGLSFKKLNITFDPRDLMAIADAIASLGSNDQKALETLTRAALSNNTPS